MYRKKLLISKAIKISSFAFLLLVWGFAYGDAPQELKQGQDRIVLNVENMTWPGCVVAVRNSLRALKGVSQVQVDLDEKLATVIYETAMVETTAMIAATTNIGFPSSIKILISNWFM